MSIGVCGCVCMYFQSFFQGIFKIIVLKFVVSIVYNSQLLLPSLAELALLTHIFVISAKQTMQLRYDLASHEIVGS